MPKSASSSTTKGKSAAPSGAREETEREGEWRALNHTQRRRVVGAESCVSFHPVVGHPLYPRLTVLRFLPTHGEDRVLLVRDPTSVELLKHDLRSALHWQSLLFFSTDQDIRDAIFELMSDHRKAMAWSWLDDEIWRSPAWPTMMGVSPWRPNRVVELFRKSVRELLEEVGAEDSPESAPTFDQLEVMFAEIVRAVEAKEVWDEKTGAMFPQRAVFVPPSFFGARPRSVAEREAEERKEREEVARQLEDELVEEGVLEGPARADVPAATPGPTAGGAEGPTRADASVETPGSTAGGEVMEEEELGGAGGGVDQKVERGEKRAAARRERRHRRAEERQKEREAAQREEQKKKEEEEEVRAERLLAAARKRYERDQERIRRKAAEGKKKREEEAAAAAAVKGSQEGEEKRRRVEGGRPGEGKPKRTPWWVEKEVKEAEKEAKKLKEAADRAQLLASQKRAALEGAGSSVPSEPGPSGTAGVGGRGGPSGGVAASVAPRGGRGPRGIVRGRGAGPGFSTRGSFRQPTTQRMPHSTPRQAFPASIHPPSRMHAPSFQQPPTPLAPPAAPASLDSSMLSLLASMTSTLGEWARQNPAALSSLSGAPSPVVAAPSSAPLPAASPSAPAPVRYLAADYRVGEGSVGQVTDVLGPAQGWSDAAAPAPRR